MIKYRNERHRFEIELPDGWHTPGFMSRLFGLDANPKFYGPHEKIRVKYDSKTPEPHNAAALMFAIGPIYPEPSVEQHQKNLEIIARRHMHCVRGTGKIALLGKDHATISYEVPRPGFENILVYRFKNYHIIHDQTEYVATAKLATLPHSWWPMEFGQEYMNIPRNVTHDPAVTNLHAVYMYEEDYDDIIKTFKLF